MYLMKYCRHISKNISSQSKLFFENVSSKRSLIRVSGTDVYAFLQGLITNDVSHIQKNVAGSAIFTMFLNKQGRVLYDAIVYKSGNLNTSCFIECDRNAENQLKQHLQFFRIRRNVKIDIVNDELNIWVCFRDYRKHCEDITNGLTKIDEKIVARTFDNGGIASIDPRFCKLGMRLIAPKNLNLNDFQGIDNNIECVLTDQAYNYTKHRYVFGISEGSSEIPPTKSFPFEVNCDYLHGISFHKGCYLGQEFTARTYHTGVIRKRIMPIVIHSYSVQPGDDIEYNTPIVDENGQLIGKLRGHQNEYAIGLLKVDLAIRSKYLKINNLYATTKYPNWWPEKH